MAIPKFKHIYGPVYSWRMGMSLGIDPLSSETKYCNFACTYCQLGNAHKYGLERQVFISPQELIDEVKQLPADCRIDYLTFSGNGDPSLAANLGDLIRAVRSVRQDKVAVITNAANIGQTDVQADLALADLVLVKLDGADEAALQAVNIPAPGVTFKDILAGIKRFRSIYKGKLALQMMLVDSNKDQAQKMADLAREIGPEEVQLNTPLRPSHVKPLSEAEMAELKQLFVKAGLKVLSVYEEEKRDYQPFDADSTVKRHGRYKG